MCVCVMITCGRMRDLRMLLYFGVYIYICMYNVNWLKMEGALRRPMHLRMHRAELSWSQYDESCNCSNM